MSEGREHEVRRLSRLAPHGIVLALRDALTELDATRSERDALREALDDARRLLRAYRRANSLDLAQLDEEADRALQSVPSDPKIPSQQQPDPSRGEGG